MDTKHSLTNEELRERFGWTPQPDGRWKRPVYCDAYLGTAMLLDKPQEQWGDYEMRIWAMACFYQSMSPEERHIVDSKLLGDDYAEVPLKGKIG